MSEYFKKSTFTCIRAILVLFVQVFLSLKIAQHLQALFCLFSLDLALYIYTCIFFILKALVTFVSPSKYLVFLCGWELVVKSGESLPSHFAH